MLKFLVMLALGMAAQGASPASASDDSQMGVVAGSLWGTPNGEPTFYSTNPSSGTENPLWLYGIAFDPAELEERAEACDRNRVKYEGPASAHFGKPEFKPGFEDCTLIVNEFVKAKEAQRAKALESDESKKTKAFADKLKAQTKAP